MLMKYHARGELQEASMTPCSLRCTLLVRCDLLARTAGAHEVLLSELAVLVQRAVMIGQGTAAASKSELTATLV